MKKTFTLIIKQYYALTKPGIIYGNLITVAAGFLFASKGSVDSKLLITTLAGIALVIASACVFNNVIDRNIDRKMARTKQRAIASGAISVRCAIIFATVLSILGFAVLLTQTNLLVAGLGLLALVSYILFYGIAKRHTVHGTLVGTLPGALPLVAGYAASTGQLDVVALILFLIMVTWQMPHFYAIAIYRLKDYKAAGIPVMPAKKGLLSTKIQIFIYTLLYTLVAANLSILGHASVDYLIVMVLVGFIWLQLAAKGFSAKDSETWARNMFTFSLVVLLVFSAMISLEGLIQ